MIFRHDNFAAVRGEHADGGFVEFGKSDVGDAAREKGDARATRACGRKGLAKAPEEKIVVDVRKKAIAFGEAEKLENAHAPRDGLQTGALIEAKKPSGVFDEMRSGEEMPENEIARDAREPGAFVVAFDASAGVLDELAVFDAGGAGGFAGTAVETFVDVIDEGSADGDGRRRMVMQLALKNLDHLVDAAARRIGFEIPQAVSGAGGQAKAAVDAACIILVRWRGAGNGGRLHGSAC